MKGAPHHPDVVAGYHDAIRGHTACPSGLPEVCLRWAHGYDMAFEQGEAQFQRFGKLTTKRRG